MRGVTGGCPPGSAKSSSPPGIPPWVAWDHDNDTGGVWPKPDDRDADLITHPETAWLDGIGQRVRARLSQARGMVYVVGHGDWESQNLGWRDKRPWVVHDWDSVVSAPERSSWAKQPRSGHPGPSRGRVGRGVRGVRRGVPGRRRTTVERGRGGDCQGGRAVGLRVQRQEGQSRRRPVARPRRGSRTPTPRGCITRTPSSKSLSRCWTLVSWHRYALALCQER